MDGGPTIQQTTYNSTRCATTPFDGIQFPTNKDFVLQLIQEHTNYIQKKENGQ
jgi:hypothetical protein